MAAGWQRPVPPRSCPAPLRPPTTRVVPRRSRRRCSHEKSIDIGSAGKGCASGGRQSKSNGRGVAGCGTARSLRGRCPRAACRFLLGGQRPRRQAAPLGGRAPSQLPPICRFMAPSLRRQVCRYVLHICMYVYIHACCEDRGRRSGPRQGPRRPPPGHAAHLCPCLHRPLVRSMRCTVPPRRDTAFCGVVVPTYLPTVTVGTLLYPARPPGRALAAGGR